MNGRSPSHQPHHPAPADPLPQRQPPRSQTTAADLRSLAKTAQPPADARGWARDGRARQGEFEARNARLQKACRQLGGRLQKYTALYDHAPIACLNLDSQGTICEANLAAASLLGFARRELLQQRFDLFLEETGRPAFLTLLESAFTTRAPLSTELVLQPLRAPLRCLQFIAVVSRDGRECHASLVQLPASQPAETRWREVHDRLHQRLHDCAAKLAAANAALLDSQARWQDLFDASPIGIALHDDSGHFVEVNPAYIQMLGCSKAELLRLGVKAITHPEDVQEARRLFGELRDGQRDRYQRQKRFVRADGEVVWAHSTASAVRDAGGKLRYVISLVDDITQRRAVGEALHQSQRLYRELVENVNTIILRWSPSGRINFLNEYGQKLFSKDERSCHGRDLMGLVIPELESTGRDLRHVFRQIASRPQDYPAESCEVLCSDGQIRWVTWSNQAVHDAQGGVAEILSVGTDVTERRQMQREMLDIAEQERHRIGRDLHDSMGGQLAGAGILAAVLARKLAVAAHPDAHFAGRILQVVNQAIAQTRSIAHTLCPVALDGGSLLNALREFALTCSERFQISCQVESLRHPEVGNAIVATHLLRIVEEAVSNAVRHGQARHVTIALRKQQGQVVLEIRDDGVGFLTSQSPGQGLGLRSMRYRAELLGAGFSLESSPGRGTCVACRLPAVSSAQIASQVTS